MKRIFFLLLLSTLFLSSCTSTNPKTIAQGDAIRTQAETDAANAEQTREIEREEQDWLNEKRTETAYLWASVKETAYQSAKFLTKVVFFGLTVITVVLTWSVSYGTVKTAQAYAIAAYIRARILPLDANGMRPQFLFDDVEMLPADTFLGHLGLQHVRKTKFWLNDTATGKSGMIDTTKPASNVQHEIYRQVLIHKLTLDSQKKSAFVSRTGEVAEAMGHSNVFLPDVGRMLLELTSGKSQVSSEGSNDV